MVLMPAPPRAITPDDPLRLLPPFSSYLRLESTDPATNRARFYAVTLQATLWDELALVCGWGRIGTAGQLRVVHCADEAAARTALAAVLRRRLRHGYQVIDWQ